MAKGARYLTEEQWKKFEPLLPELKPGLQGGSPWTDNRIVLEGIIWILRTGVRWEDLPEQYPSPSTCWLRLKFWEEKNLWLELWRKHLSDVDQETLLDWEG